VGSLLLCLVKDTLNNPIVTLDTVELAPESQTACSAQDCEAFKSLLKLKGFFFSKGDTSPLEETSLLNDVRNYEGLILSKQSALLLG